MINRNKYKGIVGKLPAMKAAIKGTFRDDGILLLKPTQKLLGSLGALEQWLLSLKRYDSGTEAVLQWLNSYYTSATNHTAQVNQKKQARLQLTEEELHDPFN